MGFCESSHCYKKYVFWEENILSQIMLTSVENYSSKYFVSVTNCLPLK